MKDAIMNAPIKTIVTTDEAMIAFVPCVLKC